MSYIAPPLTQGVGYGVVVGLGLSFAAGKNHCTHQLHVVDTFSNDTRNQAVEINYRRG